MNKRLFCSLFLSPCDADLEILGGLLAANNVPIENALFFMNYIWYSLPHRSELYSKNGRSKAFILIKEIFPKYYKISKEDVHIIDNVFESICFSAESSTDLETILNEIENDFI